MFSNEFEFKEISWTAVQYKVISQVTGECSTAHHTCVLTLTRLLGIGHPAKHIATNVVSLLRKKRCGRFSKAKSTSLFVKTSDSSFSLFSWDLRSSFSLRRIVTNVSSGFRLVCIAARQHRKGQLSGRRSGKKSSYNASACVLNRTTWCR